MTSFHDARVITTDKPSRPRQFNRSASNLSLLINLEMKTFLCSLSIIILLTTVTFAQKVLMNGDKNVEFTNLEAEYQNTQQLKPVLKNFGNRSIYLFWFYPFKAQILRFNDETKQWETGHEGYYCLTEMFMTKNYGPLEIKPSEEFEDLDLSFSEAFNDSKQFILEDSRYNRAIKGKYKLRIPYSFEEWSANNIEPKATYQVESEEFIINPN